MPQYVPPHNPRGVTAGPLSAGEAAALTAKLADGRGLRGLWATPPLMLTQGTNGSVGLYLADVSGEALALTVCGSAIAPPLVTGNVCPPCGTLDVSTLPNIQGIYFEPCDFQVTATNLCGGTAGSGSGSSGNGPANAVRIKLTGKTETVDVPYRIVFCPDTCSNLVQYQYECFRRGLYIGRWFDPPVSCGSGSGGSGVV